MDVRCDRCETEYELDDDSVTEGGASVQCTTCGHTFVVGRNGLTIAQIVATPPAGISDLAGPQAADWLLATEDGQTHRFRDLTTLQKWVVERKVTREDRVSQRGGPWRPLADVDELGPFFEVVDQADRARSGGSARRSGSGPRSPASSASRVTPTRQTAVSRQGGSARARHAADDLDGSVGSLSARLDSDSTASPTLDRYGFPPVEDKFETMAIFQTQRRLKIVGIAGFVALAVTAAFIGFSRPRWLPFFKTPDPARVVEAAAPPAPLAVAPEASKAPAPVAAPSVVPPSPPVPGGGVRGPVVDPLPSRAVSPAADRAGGDAPSGPGMGNLGTIKGKTYERLVADADRLMENGSPVRAQKLLDQALAIQPNGVAALSGVAYLLLDRQKPLAAISTFKRALGYSPEFAPALFGLGEAYRAQGDLPHAAESYRKYIGVAPGGPDAPAARRQLKEIEALAPRRAAPEAAPASAPPPSKESAKGDDPPAATPDPAP